MEYTHFHLPLKRRDMRITCAGWSRLLRSVQEKEERVEMDKEKLKEHARVAMAKARTAMSEIKEKTRVAMAKARAAMSEIKANFKADEGATGARKIQSRFVNLWKSGTPGRVALIATPVAVLLFMVLVFGVVLAFGGGGSGSGVQSPVPSDKSVAQSPVPAEPPPAAAGGTDMSLKDIAMEASRAAEEARKAAKEVQEKSAVPAENPVAQSPVRQDTLVVKGLYMRQSGDDALNVCKKIVAASEGLVVVDFRNGIECEKDDAMKAKEKQAYENEKRAYEERVSLAMSSFDLFLKWRNRHSKMYEDGKVQDMGKIDYRIRDAGDLRSMSEFAWKYDYQIEWTLNPPNAMGILSSSDRGNFYNAPLFTAGREATHHNKDSWFRMVLKNIKGEDVAREQVVKNWLAGQYLGECPNPPSTKYKIDKKNLIKIAVKKPGMREDELPGLVFVWIDDNGNVKEVFFNEDGMDRLFNAGDVSAEEFARLLIKNYAGIPRLGLTVNEERLRERGATIQIKNSTWIYKDPRGYQVKLFERSAYYCSDNGALNVKIGSNDAYGSALSIVDKAPKKFFTFFAIKPEASRKFD